MTLSAAQIAELRARYGRIERVDPTGTAYSNMRRLLDALSQDDLKMLASANIKWLSRLAINRITKH